MLDKLKGIETSKIKINILIIAFGATVLAVMALLQIKDIVDTVLEGDGSFIDGVINGVLLGLIASIPVTVAAGLISLAKDVAADPPPPVVLSLIHI